MRTESDAHTVPVLVPKMPPGLVEVMEGLTRDVLKHNPTNIYEFCANHMQKLLEIRDGKSTKASLTLDDKICYAQKKVRQRAEQRWQKYDKVMQSQPTKIKVIYPDISTESLNTSTIQPLLLNSPQGPLNLDKEFSADSEAENSLSHKPIDITETIDNDVLRVNVEKKFDENSEVAEGSKRNEEIKAPTIEIYDVNSENVTPGEIDCELENKSDAPISIDNQSEKVDTEIDQEEDRNAVKDENSINETEGELLNNIPSADTMIFEHHIDENINKTQNNQIKDSALGNDDENVKTNIALEDEKHNTEINEIPNDETQCIDVPLLIEIQESNSTFNHSENAIPNIAEIETSHGAAIEDMNPLKLEISELPQNKQTDDITSESTIIESENTHEHLKDEIKTDSTENTKELQDSLAENQLQSGIEGNFVGLEESDHEIVLSQNHEESSASNIISNENASNSPNKNDIEKILDVVLDDKHGHIAGSILNENDGDFIEAKEKSPEESLITQTFESYDNKANETYLGDDDLKRDGNVEDEYVKENTSESSVEKSLVTEDDNTIISDKTEHQSYKPTQDEVIDHGNMNLETAAITIQKVFRNFLFKSRADSTFDDTANDDTNASDDDSDNKVESEFSVTSSSLNKERRGLGITRMDTVLQTVNEEKSLSLSTDDSSTLSSAATIIQSHVRGFLARNKLNSYRTVSTNSLVNSNPSLETDTEQIKNKTILNIHIVPEGSNLSRDESIITSMDLSLDGSPPSSINLHPLGYDKSERRKQLKREDAIQSISPPSNNSGKLSEDSVKDVIINEVTNHIADDSSFTKTSFRDSDTVNLETPTDTRDESVINSQDCNDELSTGAIHDTDIESKSLHKMNSDEMDVVTPFVPIEVSDSFKDVESTSKLVFSGEFHDMVLPTQVSRSDTTVVRGE